MLFNSFDFLVFFIIVTTLYFVLPFKFRWVLLLVSSYIFYMAWDPWLIILIVFSTYANYIISHKIYRNKSKKKKKNLLVLSCVINFGLLFIFKYLVYASETFRFVFENFGLIYPVKEFDIILPMGISFYTFQAAAYTIDVYKGEIKPVRNYGKFSLFITFFPQLVAGPIERSKHLIPQFYKKHYFEIGRIVVGLKIMAWGFFKKLVIADRTAILVDNVYNNVEYFSGLTFIVATLLFTFQIYCDFSGYSDIAVGCGKVLGFEFMENFERPFLSKSVKEFWRRWHISLSSWFMDYLYIPLGGNKKGVFIQQRNIFITFLVSGLWHGANWTFVLWGGLHGLYIVFGNLTKMVRDKVRRKFGYNEIKGVHWLSDFLSVCATFGFIVISFIFFRANTISDAIYIFEHLLWGFKSWTNPEYLYHMLVGFKMGVYDLIIIVISIIILMAVEILGGSSFREKLFKTTGILSTCFYGVLVSLILVWGVYYNGGAFIYFAF